MRPIEKGTLDRLKARLAEAREAEYQALLNVANATIIVLDSKLDDLRDWRRVTTDLQECINRLERDCLVSTETAEAEVYASKERMPTEWLGEW